MAEAIDPVMIRVREAFTKTGWTMKELGERMGYPPEMARQSVWQFLTKTADPRVGTVRRFAKAVGVPFVKLLT